MKQIDIIDIRNPDDLIVESSNTLEYLIIAPNEFEDHADNLKNLYSNDVINEDKLITEYVLKSEIKHILNKENLVANDIKSFIELKLNENSGIRYFCLR